MEDYRNLLEQCLLNARKLLLDVVYYRHHRCDWEKDWSADRLALAEENLKQAGRMLDYLISEGNNYER